MRYQLLKPPSPIDLSKHVLSSFDSLHILAPPVDELDLETEADAVQACRALYPDFRAAPVRVQIDRNGVWMMGITDGHPESGEFPLFVRAIASTARDRETIANYAHFDRRLWGPQVQRAVLGGATALEIEVRSTATDDVARTDAVVGRLADGRTVISFDLHGHAMSISFTDKAHVLEQ